MSRTTHRNIDTALSLVLAITLALICFLLVSCAATYETKDGSKISFQVTDGKAIERIIDERR